MTDKTDSKERDAFEAHWLREGNPRNSLAKWQDADNVPPKMRGAYVMACTRDAWSAFQAGRASLAASAVSEPVAQAEGVFEFWWADHMPNATQAEAWYEWRELMRPGSVAVTHPSPPEGMVGGWMPIETAPKDGARILLHPAVEVHDAWSKGHWSEQQGCWMVGGSASGVAHTYWLPLPPAPPTSSADSGKGE